MASKKNPHRAGWGRTQHEDAVIQFNSTPIYVGSKVVGRVIGDTFQKNIRKNHFLHTPPAIAFDLSSLDDAEAAGAFLVEVTDSDSRSIYKTSIPYIRSKGFYFNRGFGKQIALPMDEWNRNYASIQISMF